jgi:hypothetical protein
VSNDLLDRMLPHRSHNGHNAKCRPEHENEASTEVRRPSLGCDPPNEGDEIKLGRHEARPLSLGDRNPPADNKPSSEREQAKQSPPANRARRLNRSGGIHAV